VSKIVPEIIRQVRAVKLSDKLPTSITMSFDTKCALLNQMTDNQLQRFAPAPIATGEPDKFMGLPITIDYTIPNGEVRVA
jgi:hypothetical protein